MEVECEGLNKAFKLMKGQEKFALIGVENQYVIIVEKICKMTCI